MKKIYLTTLMLLGGSLAAFAENDKLYTDAFTSMAVILTAIAAIVCNVAFFRG